MLLLIEVNKKFELNNKAYRFQLLQVLVSVVCYHNLLICDKLSLCQLDSRRCARQFKLGALIFASAAPFSYSDHAWLQFSFISWYSYS